MIHKTLLQTQGYQLIRGSCQQQYFQGDQYQRQIQFRATMANQIVITFKYFLIHFNRLNSILKFLAFTFLYKKIQNFRAIQTKLKQ